jgi:hypothetical protein
MKNKIVGILVCMLLIATTLSATGAMNVQTKQDMNENNDLEPNISTPTNPGIITIKIVGKITEVYDQYNLLGGAIQVNDIITGKYIYESGQPDLYPEDPTYGYYEYTSSTFGMELKTGGFEFKTNPSNVQFGIIIFNDDIYSGDEYIVTSEENLPLSNGLLVDMFYWGLADSTITALSSDALPTTAPVLSDWEYNQMDLLGFHPTSGNPFAFRATITKATKSRARDVHSIMQPILTWLLERFANMFPILRYLIGI